MNIKQMLYTLIKRPHVVEQGESNGFTYRKWSDGTAELWGDKQILTNTWAKWGETYYSDYTPVLFPQDLFIETPTITYTRIGGIEGWACNTGRTKDGISSVYIVRPSSANPPNYFDIAIHVIGKWK